MISCMMCVNLNHMISATENNNLCFGPDMHSEEIPSHEPLQTMNQICCWHINAAVTLTNTGNIATLFAEIGMTL